MKKYRLNNFTLYGCRCELICYVDKKQEAIGVFTYNMMMLQEPKYGKSQLDIEEFVKNNMERVK